MVFKEVLKGIGKFVIKEVKLRIYDYNVEAESAKGKSDKRLIGEVKNKYSTIINKTASINELSKRKQERSDEAMEWVSGKSNERIFEEISNTTDPFKRRAYLDYLIQQGYLIKNESGKYKKVKK
jgi:hypothetical protein